MFMLMAYQAYTHLVLHPHCRVNEHTANRIDILKGSGVLFGNVITVIFTYVCTYKLVRKDVNAFANRNASITKQVRII